MRKLLSTITSLFILIMTPSLFSQKKQEREFRILASQFPVEAHKLIESELEDVKRLRFYKEIDGEKESYEAKFKKDRLWYSIEFNKIGVLEDVEITIKAIDVPEDTFDKITSYLNKSFTKYRIKKIQQQYVSKSPTTTKTTIKNAFQNLLLPTINYEIMVGGKQESGYLTYEILYNATGDFQKLRQSLPPNYDHVLY